MDYFNFLKIDFWSKSNESKHKHSNQVQKHNKCLWTKGLSPFWVYYSLLALTTLNFVRFCFNFVNKLLKYYLTSVLYHHRVFSPLHARYYNNFLVLTWIVQRAMLCRRKTATNWHTPAIPARLNSLGPVNMAAAWEPRAHGACAREYSNFYILLEDFLKLISQLFNGKLL